MRFILITLALGMWFHALPSHGITHANTDNNMINHREAGLSSMSQATFGGGCFWCIDAVFSRIKGVQEAVPGYAGGHTTNPSYREVSMGDTGHAEVVRVTFDADQVSYLQLLEVFFRIHDPTTPDRQGADVGTQYRSIILYHDDEQRQTAEKVKEALDAENIWDDPIVTEIVPLETFYEAEEEHQNYFEKNPDRAYCQMVILPKVEKFKSMFNDLLDTEQ
ncbi:MAG: peptide-methionine (S)-S-oxide reductase MsrA [Bacteroidales bacterium]